MQGEQSLKGAYVLYAKLIRQSCHDMKTKLMFSINIKWD